MSVTQSVSQSLAPTEDVNTTVVMAVADATGTPAVELPPLYDVIDPDALSAMFQQGPGGRARTGVRVTFTMAGCDVSIRDGEVTVTPESEPTTEIAASQARRED